MSALDVECPNCFESYSISNEQLGRRGRCKRCGHVFSLSSLSDNRRSASSPRPQSVNSSDAGDAASRPDSADRSPRPETELSGQFGRYRIIKQLGQGGMGKVYLAHDNQLDREVALKVPFFTSQDGPLVLDRFYREARAAAAFDHPNLCPVYEVGQFNETHYLTMPFIQGKPLSQVIDPERMMPQRQVAALVRKLALALVEAHAHGVIHRDLKPSNIMISRQRELVIMDFGLARRLDLDDARLTKSGALVGTPLYMAPEQVRGDHAAISPATDVYSLGVILYEMLTGRCPFDGPVSLVLACILASEPPRPSEYRRDLDPALEAICLKAIAKNSQDRYTTMAAFAAALGSYLSGRSVLPSIETTSEPVSDRPSQSAPLHSPGMVTLASQFVQQVIIEGVAINLEPKNGPRAVVRKPSLQGPTHGRFWVAAVTGTALVILLGTLAYRSANKQKMPSAGPSLPRPDSSPAVNSALESTGRSPAAGQETVDLLRLMDPKIHSVSSTWSLKDGQLVSLGESAGAWSRMQIPYTPPEEYILDIELTPLADNSALALGLLMAGNQFVVAIDHRWGGYRGTIPITTIDGIDRVWAGGNPYRCEGKAFKRDTPSRVSCRVEYGHFIVTCDGRRLLEWSGDPFRLTMRPQWRVPDGQSLFIGLGPFIVNRMQVTPLAPVGPVAPWDVAFYQWDRNDDIQLPSTWEKIVASPPLDRLTSRSLAFHWGTRSPTPKVPWDYFAATATSKWELSAGVYEVVSNVDDGLRVFIDGRLVLKNWPCPPDEREMKVTVALAGGTHTIRVEYFETHGPAQLGLGLHPVDETSEARIPTSYETARYQHDSTNVLGLAISPDGRRLLTASPGALDLWDTETRKVVRRFQGNASFHGVALSPDGKRAASGDSTGITSLWDVETGAELHRFHGHLLAVPRLEFSPDGRRLISAGLDGTARLWLVPDDAQLNRSQSNVRIGHGLKGQFFLGMNFETPKISRIDPVIHWYWGEGPPDPAIPADYFSARWRGWIKAPKPGRYRFTIHSDDGVRLIIDNEKLIDQWRIGVFKSEAEVELSDRPHEIVVEFMEDNHQSLLSLQWADLEGTPTQVVPTEALFVDEVAAKRSRVPPLFRQPGFPATHGGQAWCVAIAPDGQLALSAGADGPIHVWDMATCRESFQLEGHEGGVVSAVFSTDGSRILSAGGSLVCLWDLKTRTLIRRFQGHTLTVRNAFFLPGEQRIISSGDDSTLRLWDVSTGRTLHRFLGHVGGVRELAVMPDGRSMVSSGYYDKTLRVWTIPE